MAINGSYITSDDLDAELFGEPHENTISYMRDRVERHAGRIRDLFNGFFNDSREVFERYNGDRALRRIRSRARKTSNILQRDAIIPIRTLEGLQQAKPVMQRYLMANIMARIAESNQTIDAYSDSYRNYTPHLRGFTDPDYMRVIDGVMFDSDRFGVEQSKDPENAWVAYQNLFDTDERDLDLIEQTDIMSAWDLMEIHLAAKKKDPTSVLNESM